MLGQGSGQIPGREQIYPAMGINRLKGLRRFFFLFSFALEFTG
jgi:hypothetical protein